MKNLYALDKNNNILHVREVIKQQKEKYTCINCGNELIARKGKIKAHHFSHKSDGNCSYESYLHKISKLTFYEKYKKCLNNNQPFYIEYKVKQTCISCQEIENINLTCNLKDKIKVLDLTKWFDSIEIEKGFNGFIADILLKSSKNNEVLFIEFAVTHTCEAIKIDSGIRIIEVILKNDNDLNFIHKGKIDIKNKNHLFHNFKVNHEEKKIIYPEKCTMEFETFSVLRNNKALKYKQQMSRIISDLKNRDYKHFRVLEKQEEEYGGDYFISLVNQYASKDKSFKNCYSCRFSTKNNNYYAEYDLFCKRKKCEIPNSNIGNDCDKYWIIERIR